MTNLLSIVITNYNRFPLVNQAIYSALKFVSKINGNVIVVDDASTDGSYQKIAAKFKLEIESKKLIVLRNKFNIGVTGSKNKGYLKAKAKWVGFLDSDDLILDDSIALIKNYLLKNSHLPLIFLKCIDENGALIGAKFEQPQEFDIKRFLTHTTYGEVFSFFNKEIIKSAPFDQDLRGYEGIGCARIIRKYGSAILFPEVIRCYNQRGSDRLSHSTLTNRAKLIAKGHFRLLQEFYTDFSINQRLYFIAKVFIYRIISFFYEKTH